jgi:prevent-host-death family protein
MTRSAAVLGATRANARSSSYSATEAKNEFGRLLEQAIHGEPVVITKHDSPRAVLMSFAEFQALKQAPQAGLDTLRGEFDRLLQGMQTPMARRAVDRLFRMTSPALGKAAVAGARRRG